MTPEFSLAHLTVLGATPLEQIQVAADAGYDYASLRTTPVAPGEHVVPLAGDPAMIRQVSTRLADTGVRVLDVELARIGPDDDPDDFLGFLEAAAAIGSRHIVGQLPDPDLHRATEHFGRLCDLALDFGLTVDLEFPSWMEVGDLATAAAVVAAVDRPNAGILVDALHFFRSGSSPPELAPLPRAWFRFVQLCDAPAASPTDRRGRDPHGAGKAIAPRLRRPATSRTPRPAPDRALFVGSPERRAAPRAGNRGVRPSGAGHRAGRVRR